MTQAQSAAMVATLKRSMADGEVGLDVKLVSGQHRAAFSIGVRMQVPSGEGYPAIFEPARRSATLAAWSGGWTVHLAERQDLAGRLSRDGWNRVAARLHGRNLWILLEGEPILSAADPTYDSGNVFFFLNRLGALDDGQESAAVLRDLRVSKLAVQ